MYCMIWELVLVIKIRIKGPDFASARAKESGNIWQVGANETPVPHELIVTQ